MIRKMLLLGAFFLLIGTDFAQSNRQSRAPLSIKVTAPQETVATGSAVRIRVTLTNDSDKPIVLFRTGIVPYKMEVRGSDGNPSPETERGRELREYQSKGGNVITNARVARTLNPHDTMKDEIVLTDFYDMTHMDQYTIQLSYVYLEMEIKSNILQITVTP